MRLVDMISSLQSKFDRPERPKLRDVQSIVTSSASPNDAWIRLHNSGSIAPVLCDDDRRRFAQHTEGQRLFPSDRPIESAIPSSLIAVATVASDPEGILKAEDYARGFANRLIPMGSICNDEVVWYFTENPYKRFPFETTTFGRPFQSALYTLEWSLESHGIVLEEFESGNVSERFPQLVDCVVAAWEGWRVAASRRLTITNSMEPFDRSRWQHFSDLPNPFEPLLELWRTGYRIVCPFSREDSTIRLYAKPVCPDE